MRWFTLNLSKTPHFYSLKNLGTSHTLISKRSRPLAPKELKHLRNVGINLTPQQPKNQATAEGSDHMSRTGKA